MALPGSGRYRFWGTLACSLGAWTTAFAMDVQGASSLVRGIVQIGVAAFALLVLFTLLVIARFLGRVYMDWKKAPKEGSHPVAATGEEDHLLSKIATSLAILFAVAASVTLLVVFFMMSAGAEPSSASKISSVIIRAGVSAFGLFLLYTAYRSALALLGAAKKSGEAKDHATTSEGLSLNPEITRRSFLSLLGWAWVAFTAATMGALSTCLRFAFPNVTFEPPLKFSAGFPETYSIGVDERFKDGHRVWIVRTDTGFYALSTICTHLGCTPNWLQAEQKFKCPCHGSGYYSTGVNFEGPAPRPLERFKISLSDDGQIIVDESVKFQQELGQWTMPDAFLNYKA